MTQKYSLLLAGIFALSPISYASSSGLEVEEVGSHPHNVFATTTPGEAFVSKINLSYSEWQKSSSGRFFDMEVAPVQRGALVGISDPGAPKKLDTTGYSDQAKDFVEYVNIRNEGGRFGKIFGQKGIESEIEKAEASTEVFESVFSAVIDRPLDSFNINESNFRKLPALTDKAHRHFEIPGEVVLEAIDAQHISRQSVTSGDQYVLSAFDFRNYACEYVTSGINRKMSGDGPKEKMYKYTIYVVSDVKFNDAGDMKEAEDYFGRKPSMIVSQENIFGSHLILGAKNIFAFYEEGQQTRVVMLSNIAVKKKYADMILGQGAKMIWYGVDSAAGKGLTAIAGGVEAAVGAAGSIMDSLIGGAEQHSEKSNSCEVGLAKGVIGFSKDLFANFEKLEMK